MVLEYPVTCICVLPFSTFRGLVMFEIFVFGTFWFWTLLVFEMFFLFAAIGNKKIFLSFFSLLVYFSLLGMFGNFNLFKLIIDNPWNTCYCILGYLAIGATWSVYRWYVINKNITNNYNEFIQDFLKTNAVSAVENLSEQQKSSLKENLKYEAYTAIDGEWRIKSAPTVADNKSLIISWMSFWPISILIYLLAEIVIDVFKNIFNKLKKFYQKVSDYWESKRINIE